jgi:hypothetical protein
VKRTAEKSRGSGRYHAAVRFTDYKSFSALSPSFSFRKPENTIKLLLRRKLYWLEFFVNIESPATSCMRKPINLSGFRITDNAHQAFRSATPGRTNVMTGEIRFFVRRFPQPRAKPHVVTTQNEWSILSNVNFRDRVIFEAWHFVLGRTDVDQQQRQHEWENKARHMNCINPK